MRIILISLVLVMKLPIMMSCVVTWVWTTPYRFQFLSFITIVKGMVSHDNNMQSVTPNQAKPVCMYFQVKS